MLQLSEFIWTLRFSARVVFNKFLPIDATDRSKIFIALSLYPLSFFANTPFNSRIVHLNVNPPPLLKRKVSEISNNYYEEEFVQLPKKHFLFNSNILSLLTM